MPHIISNLTVPPLDLTITPNGNGSLRVDLNVPKSSGLQSNIPFLEVTRNEQQTLLNGARQDMLKELSQSGFQVGEVKYDAKGKASFEIKGVNVSGDGSVSGNIVNNGNVRDAITKTEQNFDIRRQDIYEQRARGWVEQHGATLKSDGVTYQVTDTAARNYINERHPLNPWKRVGEDGDGVRVASGSQSTGPQSPEFKNNPTVRQVSAALERNGISPENQNPSVVAGIADAAARNGLPKVQDVVFSPDQRTAFATDRDKSDPAARVALVDTAAIANKPFEEVWQKASVSLQQAQTPAVVAQTQEPQEQKQSARTM